MHIYSDSDDHGIGSSKATRVAASLCNLRPDMKFVSTLSANVCSPVIFGTEKQLDLHRVSPHHIVCRAVAWLIMRGYDMISCRDLKTPANCCVLLALLLSNGSYLGNKASKGQCVRNFFVLLRIKCIPRVTSCSWEVSCVGRCMTYLYSMYIF
jgi:hypothetical protein